MEPGVSDPTERDRAALGDELLGIRCLLGEPEAFDQLVARWHQPLWLFLRRLTGDDEAAADAVQECWLRVLRALPRLREPAHLRAWLFTIARRVAVDRLRDRYAEPASDDVDLSNIAAEDTLADDRAEELAGLHDALARMPIVEREVLVLFYLHELSLNQLAEVLAVPVGTVKSRLFRARQMLRQQLTDRESLS
jgi:RNA polymerase sigma-70 factor (ECF subfamily)